MIDERAHIQSCACICTDSIRTSPHMQMVVHLFLFTDVLLVTKPIKKGVDKYAVVRPVRNHRNKMSNLQ